MMNYLEENNQLNYFQIMIDNIDELNIKSIYIIKIIYS